MKNKLQSYLLQFLIVYLLNLIKETVYNHTKHLSNNIIYNVINVKINESCYKLRIPHLKQIITVDNRTVNLMWIIVCQELINPSLRKLTEVHLSRDL